MAETNKKKYFREAPDPKLPNYNLPIPKLSEFFDDSYYERYRDQIIKDPVTQEEQVVKGDNALFLRGVGNAQNANILFLANCPVEEEADLTASAPSLLKSGPGTLLTRLCAANGISLGNEYYTTLCKYALPRKLKLKPTAKDIAYCSPLLEEEIKQVNPRIIVCIGKEPASYILNINLRLSKIEEGWFFSKKYQALVYVISSPVSAFYKPEYFDKLDAELSVLSKHYIALSEGKFSITEIEQHYQKIENIKDLQMWLIRMTQENNKLFAVDCEWRGLNYVVGNLRSIQFSWKEGHAVFIHLFDENNKYLFDVPYDVVKKTLQAFFNQNDIRYFGHNFCADAVWMKNHLGLDIWGRCVLDTTYAFQTFNEYEELGLKKLAAKYTDLGKYDMDLIFWLAENSRAPAKSKKEETIAEEDDDVDFKEQKAEGNDDDGYGSIPTDILFPYGCKDADATFRLAQIAFTKLQEDGVLDYYVKIKNPYVTDGFTAMMDAGIPFNSSVANKVRLAYLYCQQTMQILFNNLLKEEALSMFEHKAAELLTSIVVNNVNDKIAQLVEVAQDHSIDFDSGVKKIKGIIGNKIFIKLIPYYRHLYFIDSFNVASSTQKVEWLFNLKNYVPIKTTKNETGNAMDWSKVLLLPPKDQANYTPAVDKDTLKVYADNGDNLCQMLLEINAVSTILKTFLKGDEGGLQKFLCPDGKIYCNFSLTESNRPKSFKPNILNIPRYVTDHIKNAFKRTYAYIGAVQKEDKSWDMSGVDTEKFNRDIEALRLEYKITESITKEDLKVEEIRNCFKAQDGEYFVSADLKTAEIYAIAYLSGDKNLINALNDPDLQFAFKRIPGEKDPKVVRIAYVDDIVLFSEKAKDPSLLTPPDDPDLIRDENGELKHPGRDLHWEAVESIYFLDTPREKLDKEKTRNACGKRVNFCSGIDNFILTSAGDYIRAKNVTSNMDLMSIKNIPTSVSRTMILKNQPCIRFLFKNGIEATFHEMHKLRCWSGEEVIWKYAKDITKDDQIIAIKNNVYSKKQNSHIVNLKDYQKKSSVTTVTFDRNSKEFAYLAGLYLGDGCALHAKRGSDLYVVNQCVSNAIATNVISIIKSLGFEKQDVHAHKISDAVSNISYGGRGFGKYMCEHFGRSDTKKIPDFVFEWSYTNLQHFLAGLIDSDGSIRNSGKGWTFCNTNKNIVTQVALICSYLGYRTYLTIQESGITKDGIRYKYGKNGKYKDCYKLDIVSKDNTGLPLLHVYKQCTEPPIYSSRAWYVSKNYGKSIYKQIREACPKNNSKIKNLVNNLRDGHTNLTEFAIKEVEQYSNCLDLKSNWYPTGILKSTSVYSDVVAISCTEHEYIDMGFNSHNSAPYGASESLIERGIEIETHEKPAEGTGKKLLDAYYTPKPEVTEFLKQREIEVEETGYYLSPTGFKRHYKVPPKDGSMPEFIRKKILAGLQRQNRNIGLQSLVADTLALAVVSISKYFRDLNMEARVACPLYDALYVVCPEREVDLVHKLIKKCLSLDIVWKLKGGDLSFKTDHETGDAWGSHFNKQDEAVLLARAKNYWKDNPDSEKFKFLDKIKY